ncbi:hypothetical protein [Algoriphagus aquimarinus]
MKKTILFTLLLGIGGLATAQTSKVDLSKYPTPALLPTSKIMPICSSNSA